MLIPFAGTNQLILNAGKFESAITKVVDEKFYGYSLDNIKGIDGEVKEIFFTANDSINGEYIYK